MFAFFCILLAACGPQSHAPSHRKDSPRKVADNANTASAVEDEHPFAGDPALGWDDIDNQALMHRRFWSTKLRSKCTPAAFYPGGNVPPSFYNWPYPPEAERRRDCLGEEVEAAGASYYRFAIPSDFPKIGTCYRTKIKQLYAGVAALYDNGIRQFDWKASVQLVRSRVGDPVRVCVVWIPQNCPAHDLRGITYRTRNLRTGDSWELGSDEHMCWGA
ncbi:MAG: hypothetical protein K2W81_02665 [Sphingomonas sp.]|uniref:hypothetical protein n=1 Tax=Sphingomonas sp. TaxID=28214 RepID=UPI0025E944F5|nr:hypothetical protein [Sphingomonas sp.]MBY0282851.1 hypothetical protein [Sphingomonas sp.]